MCLFSWIDCQTIQVNYTHGDMNTISEKDIESWIRDIFQLSKEDSVEVDEVNAWDDSSSSQTRIAIFRGDKQNLSFTVKKTLSVVKKKDIRRLWILERGIRSRSIWGFLFRFAAWWFAFAGIYSMAAVCPCCGQVGCPVGASGAGVLGGILALCMQNWKQLFHK